MISGGRLFHRRDTRGKEPADSLSSLRTGRSTLFFKWTVLTEMYTLINKILIEIQLLMIPEK